MKLEALGSIILIDSNPYATSIKIGTPADIGSFEDVKNHDVKVLKYLQKEGFIDDNGLEQAIRNLRRL